MMKIVHVTEAWQGGIASYVSALIKGQSDRGHKVVLVADRKFLEFDSRILDCSIEFYESSRRLNGFFKSRNQLVNIVSKHGPDIVHVHSTFPGIYCRFPSAIHSNIIYTPHGWSFFKRDSVWIIRRAYTLVEKFLSSKAAMIHCMSREELSGAKAAGMGNRNLSVVHTGINDLFPRSGRRNKGANGSLLNVGFFGRLDYQKGIDILGGLPNYLREGVVVNVFGSEVRSRKMLPDAPCFMRHGWVAQDLLAPYMSDMDIIIIPSRWEGFSLTALEALRSGTPIIVSGGNSLSEVVINEYNGLIMREYSSGNLADLINGLTSEQCARMGNNARSVFLEAFTFDRYYERMMAMYRKVLSQR